MECDFIIRRSDNIMVWQDKQRRRSVQLLWTRQSTYRKATTIQRVKLLPGVGVVVSFRLAVRFHVNSCCGHCFFLWGSNLRYRCYTKGVEYRRKTKDLYTTCVDLSTHVLLGQLGAALFNFGKPLSCLCHVFLMTIVVQTPKNCIVLLPYLNVQHVCNIQTHANIWHIVHIYYM